MEEWPTNVMMSNLDAVKGQSLEKMCLESESVGVRVYLVRKPTTRELHGQCDMCPRQHQKNNTECSMWLGVTTYAEEFGMLYDPQTKKIIKGWQLASVDTRRHSRIARETYVRA